MAGVCAVDRQQEGALRHWEEEGGSCLFGAFCFTHIKYRWLRIS